MSSRPARAPGTSLYDTVKTFLVARGFEVRGEILGCDIVAVREGEPSMLVICEPRMTLSLELLLQGVDRSRAADEVRLAVTATRRGRDRDRRAHRPCRMLGFGMLAVDTGKGKVEVPVEPGPWRPRANLPRRRRLLGEHAARRGDPDQEGVDPGRLRRALGDVDPDHRAAAREGPKRPRDLRSVTPKVGRVLLRNVHGWFERVEPGPYRLAEAGEIALGRWGGVDAD